MAARALKKPVAQQVSEENSEVKTSPYAEFIDYSDDERTVITFRGEKFSIPAARGKWPTLALQAIAHGRNADAVEMLLGAEQWDRFNRVAPLSSDFWEFFDIFAEAGGFTLKRV